jgi:hypothetical protein
MRQHVNLPYLRASTVSGDHERGSGLRGTDIPREKKTECGLRPQQKLKGVIAMKLTYSPSLHLREAIREASVFARLRMFLGC